MKEKRACKCSYTPDNLNHKRLFAVDKVRCFFFVVPISIKFIENQIKALWTRWLKMLTNTVLCVVLFSFACNKQVNAGLNISLSGKNLTPFTFLLYRTKALFPLNQHLPLATWDQLLILSGLLFSKICLFPSLFSF